MASYEADGAIFVVHEGKTTKVPYRQNVVAPGRKWFTLSPERGTNQAIINEAEACLRRGHDVGGLMVNLGRAGPDSQMYKRGWTINLIGKPLVEKPDETPETPPTKPAKKRKEKGIKSSPSSA